MLYKICNNKGFTLIEAMISILILSFIMLGTMTWVIGAFQNTSEIASRRDATKLAQELLENDRSNNYEALCPENLAPACAAIPPANRIRTIKGQQKQFCVVRDYQEVVNGLSARASYNIIWNKRDRDITCNAATLGLCNTNKTDNGCFNLISVIARN